MLIYASAVSSSAVCEVFLGVKWLEVNMVDYYVLAQLPISLNAGSIPATSTMEINKYIKTELAKLDRGIVATPDDREQLENFAGGCGQGSLILMQMAMQYGYKLALENLQIEYENKSII